MERRLTDSGRAAPRLRQIAALLPVAGRGRVAAAVACDVLLGVLPVVSSSVMVGRVPGALAAGAGDTGRVNRRPLGEFIPSPTRRRSSG